MSASLFRGLFFAAIFALLFCALAAPLVAQEKKKKDAGPVNVPASIEKGVAWLIEYQSPDGTWNSRKHRPEVAGSTALGAYTLLKCGVPSRHPAVQKALAFVRSHLKDRTYEVGLALMLYASLPEADRPQAEINRLGKFLVAHLTEKGWGYPGAHNGQNLKQTDLSNSQYAALGLQAAQKCGCEVPVLAWRTLAQYVLALQGRYGSFRYRPGSTPSSSMCVAGTATLIICREKLKRIKGLRGLRNQIRGALSRAEGWFRKNWYLEQNRKYGKKVEDEKRWTYYYLYGLERVGSFHEVDIYAGKDWYGEGSRIIVSRQSRAGPGLLTTARFGRTPALLCSF
ncbi:MAG: prenyltransferase/squalene oxidase repeat-containing protein [Planctomycetota bacterium]